MDQGPASGAGAAILEHAQRLGFDAIGIADPATVTGTGDRLAAYLADGRHGTMNWMDNPRRASPSALWPDAKSIIVAAVNYGSGPGHTASDSSFLESRSLPGLGEIATYARGRDYHDVMKRRLKRLATWIADEYDAQVKVFVDTAPVMEKPIAVQAGIGWQGKHTNLLSREYGSWLLLGEVFTTLDLKPSTPAVGECGTCTLCLDVCPTNAFPEPYQLDSRRCISYLTIEHKGHVPQEFRAPIGNRIFGCDDCLAVCPWNKYAKMAKDQAVWPRIELTAPRLGELVELDDQSFREVFAGSPIKRTGRDRFVRNVLIAIGNSGEAGLVPQALNLLDDASPLVRAMAVWALGRLDKPEFEKQKAVRLGPETDDAVCQEWSN
jgi:epoxyqueuosine reductase